MALTSVLAGKFCHGKFDKELKYIYVTDDLTHVRKRYSCLFAEFLKEFGEREVRVFSAPGRTEIGGNHTDHQLGRVLAAAVNLDTIAVVSPRGDGKICIVSQGYPRLEIDVSKLEPVKDEENTTTSLVRGICAKFTEMGYRIDGFDACVSTTVLKGSGLSSSAAFETLVGTVVNSLFCGGLESPVTIAQIGQFAENVYFGKPSGLMDQCTSSVGGFITIDFYDVEAPVVENVSFDFSGSGYDLCIIDTGDHHANLTADYASITYEMAEVSNVFGKKYLSRVDESEFYSHISEVRKACSDRAVVRAIHFFDENAIVPLEAAALKAGDFKRFLELVKKSGVSSFIRLQNIYSPQSPTVQGATLMLALCEKLLGDAGAWRIHGGGFGGTVQAFVPKEKTDAFKAEIEKVTGSGKCYTLSVRPVGGVEIGSLII